MRKRSTENYLKDVRKFYFEKGRMPSYFEITEICNFKSKFSSIYWVDKWLVDGSIRKDEQGKLLPGKFFNPLKVLGAVKAGWPSPAEEENADTISLDDWLIENKEATFMLKVSGDSMIEAGILPGDMVIVQKGKQPKHGDIVIAEIDHEWTIKYFQKKGKAVSLKAANSKYPVIQPKEELRVAGVVTSVIRKY